MIAVIGDLFSILLVAIPSLVIHEMGHILVLYVVKASSISLTVGAGKLLWKTTIGKLNIQLHRILFIRYITASERVQPYSDVEKIIISFMGPMVNLCVAFLSCMVYYMVWSHPIVVIACLFNLWIGIINLFPFKIGQKQSDGYTIYKIIFNRYRSSK